MALKEWKPKRSIAECNALITAKGQMMELEQQVIDGRVLRVYKNLWPSVRVFFLGMCTQHKSREAIIYENDRVTFQQCLDQALRAAALLRDTYGVKKGVHVGIVSKNYPEYLVIFFAAHLLGAVPVQINAWLPTKALHHCIKLAHCQVVIADPDRAVKLDVNALGREAGTNAFLVIRTREAPATAKFPGWVSWDKALQDYRGDVQSVLRNDPGILPEDHATIFFTSGTTGLPKGVLSTQRSFLSNTFNGVVARARSFLRKGEPIPVPDMTAPQKGMLVSVPLFHATGLTGLSMLSYLLGMKIVLMNKWDPEKAAELIRRENIGAAGGVPSMVSDIIESSAAGAASIESFMFGGAPAHAGLTRLAYKAFPNAAMSQAYGSTETNAVAVSHSGEDYLHNPTSTGLASPINDICIVNSNGKIAKPGEMGEIWIKGANVMKEYYNDKEATKKAITPDGHFKTGDLGTMDEEGFIYIRDRAKDIIIRGGENIDSTTVENAIYADSRVLEVAAVAVPDRRLGELVSAVVTLKKSCQERVTEEELIATSAKSLPKFAIPVMIIIQKEPLERNPSGKILKTVVRTTAAKEWQRRNGTQEIKPKL